MNWPSVNYNHVQEYQVSGWPWVTGSSVDTTPQKIEFQKITQWITVHNESNHELYFGFTQLGVQDGKRFHVPPSGTVGPLHLKCESIWLVGSHVTTAYSVIAGLTNASTGVLQITGSSGMLGVG